MKTENNYCARIMETIRILENEQKLSLFPDEFCGSIKTLNAMLDKELALENKDNKK